jgi:hypothetical protein
MTLAPSVSSASPAFASLGFLQPSIPPTYTRWKGSFSKKKPVTPEFSASANRDFSPAFGFSMASVADMPTKLSDFFYTAFDSFGRALDRWAKGEQPAPVMSNHTKSFSALG